MTFDDLPEKSRRHLELEYSYGPFPDDGTKSALGQLTGLATEDVSKWFETQRQQNPDSTLATYRKQRREDGPWSEYSASWSQSFDHSRHLALRSTEAETSFLEKVIQSADSGATIHSDSKNYEAAPEEKHPPDEEDEDDELGLPRFMVFTASGERLKGRRRKRFDASRRMEVAKVRKVGACAECRAKKIRCIHAIEASTTTTKDSLPSNSRASSDTPEHQMLDRSDFVYDSFVDPPVPINAPFFLESKIVSSSPSLEQPAWTVSHPTPGTFSVPRHPPRLQLPSRPQTPPRNYLKTPEVASPAPAPPQTDVCPECGFKPEGDPKWHRSNLARHMRVRHSDTAPEVVCPVLGCGHTYRRSDNLKAHMRKAHGELLEKGREQGAMLSPTQARAAAEGGDRDRLPVLPAAVVGEEARSETAGKETGVGAGSGADPGAAASGLGSGSGGGSGGGSGIGAPGTADRKFRFVFSDGTG